MQKEPLVSINITTYNRCEKLKKALDSVVNQTYKNLEIIIADNHSEDGTEELCREYAAKDSRIKYFRHDENIGMTQNCNFTVRQTTGDYRYGLCDDDWIDLDCIEKSIEFANSHPDYVVIIPLTKLYDEDYNLIRVAKNHKLDQKSLNNRVKKYLQINNYNMCSGIYRMDALKQLQELDGGLMKDRVFDDWVVMTKFLTMGKAGFVKNAYFNKLNDGLTKDIESTQKLWNANDFTGDNFWEKLEQTLTESILNDNFFLLYLNEKSRKKLIKTIKNFIFIKKLLKTIKKLYLMRFLKF